MAAWSSSAERRRLPTSLPVSASATAAAGGVLVQIFPLETHSHGILAKSQPAVSSPAASPTRGSGLSARRRLPNWSSKPTDFSSGMGNILKKRRFKDCAHVGTKTHWHTWIWCFCHASSCAVISFSSNSNNSSSKPMDFRLHWSRLPQLGNRHNSCISTSRSPTGMLMPQSSHLHRFVTFLQARSYFSTKNNLHSESRWRYWFSYTKFFSELSLEFTWIRSNFKWMCAQNRKRNPHSKLMVFVIFSIQWHWPVWKTLTSWDESAWLYKDGMFVQKN